MPESARAVGEQQLASNSPAFSVAQDEDPDTNFGLTTHEVIKVRKRLPRLLQALPTTCCALSCSNLRCRLFSSAPRPTVSLTSLTWFLQPLGEGGTGETFLCKRKDNGIQEAVKIIKRPLPKCLRKLVSNEIILQSSIGEGHGNIVKTRSVVLTQSHICLFMDYVDGGTLTDLVHDRAAAKSGKEGLVMDEDEARFFFRVCPCTIIRTTRVWRDSLRSATS
jgi:hypothetical protein